MNQTATATLWRNTEFLKLWVGQTISVFGSEITNLALPLTAALILHATPAQMGILGAMGTLPFLIIGLFAGVWADRVRRRPILLGSIPVAMLAGFLTIEYLYVVTFLVGILTVFFDVSYRAFLPSLVGREHLVEGNSKLEITNSAARILGPGLAGQLIQAFTAPVAIIVDAVSFLMSALSLSMIRGEEAVSAEPREQQNVWREIREGLALVFGNRLLWALAGCTGTFNLFSNMWGAVFILYMTDDLGLSPGLIGAIAAAGAPGALVGALLARRAANRIGFGRTIIGAIFATGLGSLLIPLASGSALVVAAMLIAAWFISGFGNVVYNVNQVSLRQAITPNRLLGRLNATMRFLVWGTIPLGALIGGFLGEAIGLRPTILVATLGSLLAVLWVWFSPIRTLREQPQPVET